MKKQNGKTLEEIPTKDLQKYLARMQDFMPLIEAELKRRKKVRS